MGFKDLFKKKDKGSVGPMYLYTDDEIKELDEYICETFGNYANVFHELLSPDVHLDICVIDPTEEEPFYKLVTMGAGAYTMGVPEKYREYCSPNAEYVIFVPKDWDINNSDINWYWPLKLLKDTARLPIWCDTWLGYGHTTQADEAGATYAPSTKFNSIVLNFPVTKNEDAGPLKMSSGKTIFCYQIIPLYPEELKFKMDNGADALFDKFQEKGIDATVVNNDRPSSL